MIIDWSMLTSNALVVSIGSAIIGWYLTLFSNKKRMIHEKEINDMKLKADVVVKSRMEWIEKVRELSSDFIILHTELSNTISNYRYTVEKTNENNEITEEIINEVNNLETINPNTIEEKKYIEKKMTTLNTRLEKLIKTSEENFKFSTELHLKFKEEERELYKLLFLFKTYFPAINSKNKINKEHTEIIKLMTKSIQLITDYSSSDNLKNEELAKEYILDFSDKISLYFKKEWEKVKRIE
ncbi:hypothetical protein NGB19_06940 [Staphylococcus equorum]|uniref:hypothetical protein n=1 Tax=Staphylococcus equorum TaxID=246432 RepID=UPI002DBD0F70|nr:hypothetical protein [Staphylococcus equorum]MEB7746526.1 hypothetical protein [Staphylococcus equorum]